VDALGLLFKPYVTAASQQDRARVTRQAKDVQEATGDCLILVYVD